MLSNTNTEQVLCPLPGRSSSLLLRPLPCPQLLLILLHTNNNNIDHKRRIRVPTFKFYTHPPLLLAYVPAAAYKSNRGWPTLISTRHQITHNRTSLQRFMGFYSSSLIYILLQWNECLPRLLSVYYSWVHAPYGTGGVLHIQSILFFLLLFLRASIVTHYKVQSFLFGDVYKEISGCVCVCVQSTSGPGYPRDIDWLTEAEWLVHTIPCYSL